MKNVYVVVNGHYPMVFESLMGARKYAARVLRSYNTGLAMRIIRRGKCWADANGCVVTLTERKVYT